jgi:hypothetical protein
LSPSLLQSLPRPGAVRPEDFLFGNLRRDVIQTIRRNRYDDLAATGDYD